MSRRNHLNVVDLERYRAQRERMQATCGHSITSKGKCSWCGASVPVRFEQQPMFPEPA